MASGEVRGFAALHFVPLGRGEGGEIHAQQRVDAQAEIGGNASQQVQIGFGLAVLVGRKRGALQVELQGKDVLREAFPVAEQFEVGSESRHAGMGLRVKDSTFSPLWQMPVLLRMDVLKRGKRPLVVGKPLPVDFF